MTNAEVFIGDEDLIDTFIEEFCDFAYKRDGEFKYLYLEETLEAFFKKERKPVALTEEERVILRNLRYEKGAYEYTKIGRTELDSEGNCDLILIDSDNESVWWGEYGHLFQFIKERRRIRDKRIIRR